jgi:hypothetical protein
MPITSLNTQGILEAVPGYLLVPTGGKVIYVHHSGSAALNGLPAGMAANPDGFFQSVNTALGACQTGRGDLILCLPGHAENITADAWSNLGTKTDITVRGLGGGTNRPTFTWTVAGSTLLMDAANFSIENCRLFLAGAHAAGSALTVAAPITVSAAGCEISSCEIAWGFDADQIVTIGITTTAAADYFRFNDNDCYAETAAVPTTTFMRLVGADFMQMHNTRIVGPGSTTTLGPVQFLTTASLKINWRNSTVQNQLASSIHAVTGMAGLTGTVHQCGFGILDNATAVGFVTPGNVQFTSCQTSNDNGVGSAVIPA